MTNLQRIICVFILILHAVGFIYTTQITTPKNDLKEKSHPGDKYSQENVISAVFSQTSKLETEILKAFPNGGRNSDDYRQYSKKCSEKKSPGQILYHDETPFIVEQGDLCKGEVFLFIAVHSNPRTQIRRNIIRETWASVRHVNLKKIYVAFFLGNPGDPHIMENLIKESNVFGDMVIRDYTESYRNMTRKHLTIMEWVTNHCSHAKYLMKVDDDTFVDIFHAAYFLQSYSPPGFYCNMIRNARVKRVRSKWVVSWREYAPKSYPNYCEGFGYILPANLTSKILWCSRFSKFVWIDDAYISGILAHRIALPREGFLQGHSYAHVLPSLTGNNLKDFIFLYFKSNIFFPRNFKDLWRTVVKNSYYL